MVEIPSALSTTLIGMMGVVIGAIISNYFNQRIARQAAKKDIIFKKRVEYFENVVKCIDKNIKLYYNSMKSIEKNSKTSNKNKIVNSLKNNRMKFDPMTSPLYLDTRKISQMIRKFVSTEKKIFVYFSNFSEENEDESIRGLRASFRELKIIGSQIITELRTNLLKE